MTVKQNKRWVVPALLALGLINIVFGALQAVMIGQALAAGSTMSEVHYTTMPIPVLLHIVAGVLFNLLSPFQFSASIRARWPAWHWWSGRFLILAGVVAAFTAIWMNETYPQFGGFAKYSAVWVFSLGLIACLGLAIHAVLNGDIANHRAWMMRAVAIGLGPATQRLFFIPAFMVLGNISEAVIGIGVWFGFLLNLFVVEWLLLRQRSRMPRPGRPNFPVPGWGGAPDNH